MALTAEQADLADSLARAADLRLAAGDISELERDQVAQEAQRARYAVSLARETARIAQAAFARALGDDGVAPRGSLEDGLDGAAAPAPAIAS
jgi:outer membrane protein TolC